MALSFEDVSPFSEIYRHELNSDALVPNNDLVLVTYIKCGVDGQPHTTKSKEVMVVGSVRVIKLVHSTHHYSWCKLPFFTLLK